MWNYGQTAVSILSLRSQACRFESYGQFMEFETYTYAPIDLDGIDVKYLNDTQRRYLNDYHRAVYEKVAPLIAEEEREWLKEATREV